MWLANTGAPPLVRIHRTRSGCVSLAARSESDSTLLLYAVTVSDLRIYISVSRQCPISVLIIYNNYLMRIRVIIDRTRAAASLFAYNSGNSSRSATIVNDLRH